LAVFTLRLQDKGQVIIKMAKSSILDEFSEVLVQVFHALEQVKPSHKLLLFFGVICNQLKSPLESINGGVP
jgi:hypothetical protein